LRRRVSHISRFLRDLELYGQQTDNFIEGPEVEQTAGRCINFRATTNLKHLAVENIEFFMALQGEIGVVRGSPKIISLNVGRPRLAVYKGQTINTGIFKQPVEGPVRLCTLNLEGDRQADLSVHGGPYKAVYAYPAEHYPFWRGELPGIDLPWGVFGENFTTEGLVENDLHIGDRLKIADAIVVVRQTRTPCYKLAAKFQRDDMIERFLVSGRSGVYFSVEREGTVQAGDLLELVSKAPDALTVAEMNQLVATDRYDRALLEKAIATPALPEDWREHFLERLARITSVSSS
jgi:MOSC domain-containing protein YiiM